MPIKNMSRTTEGPKSPELTKSLVTGYTMHADPTVRAIASEVLRRFIRAFPSRRNEVLVGMAAFAAKIPDEFPEVISFAFSAKRLSSFCMHVELDRHLRCLLQDAMWDLTL